MTTQTKARTYNGTFKVWAVVHRDDGDLRWVLTDMSKSSALDEAQLAFGERLIRATLTLDPPKRKAAK